MITFTPKAIDRIIEVLSNENPIPMVRLSVVGKGCSGFSYDFSLDTKQQEGDHLFEISRNYLVAVDFVSMEYLKGSEVDYVTSGYNSQLLVNNPNAVASCGCGMSFSIA